jgi:TonB family protein
MTTPNKNVLSEIRERFRDIDGAKLSQEEQSPSGLRRDMRPGLLLLASLMLTACGPYPTHMMGTPRPAAADPLAQAAADDMRGRAEAGDVVAERELGVMYMKGQGTLYDPAQAAEWFGKAAAAGDPAAETYLAALYAAGAGIPKDLVRAFSLLGDAAKQGYVKAETAVGFEYMYGEGTSLDYAQALAWFKKAAADGDADASEDLGYMYWHGMGMVQDIPGSIGWYKQAAERGSRHSQLFLAGTLALGLDVPQDMAASDAYFAQAASGVMQSTAELAPAMKAIVETHAHLNYPEEATKKGQAGAARVEFECADRKASDVKVTRSSGFPLLDAAARQAVLDSVFPARAASLRDYHHFIIEVNYGPTPNAPVAPATN